MAIEATVTCRGHFANRPLKTVDLAQVTRDLESGALLTGDFKVDLLADGAECGALIGGPLFPAEDIAKTGLWCLVFAGPDGARWCLSHPSRADSFRRYVFCGGEHQVLDSCALPVDVMLDAVRHSCVEGSRSSRFHWRDMIEALNL